MTQILDYIKSDAVKRTMIVGVLLFWCAAMVAVRVKRTSSGYYVFLLGNLFLAFVPLIFSTGLRLADKLHFNWIVKVALFCLWLLFLPNAPYILTDILHLPRASEAPAWYDLALLLSCSGTGLLMGYLSLVDVHGLVSKTFSPILGWLFAVTTLVLSGFGIYLGRFLRWNSWDVITSPTLLLDLFHVVAHPTGKAGPGAVTFIFGIILALGYISLRLLLAQSNQTNS